MPIRMTGLNSGLDTESIISELMKAYRSKSDKYTKAQTKLSWTQDAWKDLNTKVYGFYKNVSNLKYSSGYSLKKSSSSDPTKASVSASGSAVTGTQKLNILSLAQSGYLTGAKLSDSVTKSTTLRELGYSGDDVSITVKNGDGTTKEVTISSEDNLSKIMSSFSEAGLNANYDEGNRRIYLSAKTAGENSDFELVAGSEDATKVLDALGLDTAPTDSTKDAAVKIKGTDAVIKLNKVEYRNTSNTFSINGLTINVSGVTGEKDEDAISITTDVDAQGIYDKIKDFLSEYNSLMKEMSELFNAESAGSYEPLTDEEKESMSDTEIEKWESKIKSSLLRRDSTLSGIMSAMSLSMSQTYEINGKKYSLSSFGISTMSYFLSPENEKYSYHIDGDEDDSNTSGNTDKLMAAINNDPDAVIDFMKQLTSGLYSAIDAKMKSTTLSSAYTIYNDKQMQTQYNEYNTLIKNWEEKVQDKEDYYYKMFSKMETALGTLNSNSSYLSSMLG